MYVGEQKSMTSCFQSYLDSLSTYKIKAAMKYEMKAIDAVNLSLSVTAKVQAKYCNAN